MKFKKNIHFSPNQPRDLPSTSTSTKQREELHGVFCTVWPYEGDDPNGVEAVCRDLMWEANPLLPF
ncbi:hypothetical protein V6Z11_A06G123500 [Gossypium hirsutum]